MLAAKGDEWKRLKEVNFRQTFLAVSVGIVFGDSVRFVRDIQISSAQFHELDKENLLDLKLNAPA